MDHSSYRYEPMLDHNAELRQELVNLARQKLRYGYRRLHALLTRRGQSGSPQRVYRLYKSEGLAVRRLKRKRLSRPAAVSPDLHRANQEWALDFASDAPATGQGIRVLAIVDAFTRECVTLEGGFCQRGWRSMCAENPSEPRKSFVWVGVCLSSVCGGTSRNTSLCSGQLLL
jgi:putative transposase